MGNSKKSQCCVISRSDFKGQGSQEIGFEENQEKDFLTKNKIAEYNHNFQLREKRLVQGEMVYIPGGSFLMGTNNKEGFPADGEGPIQRVTMDPFYIDPHTITNKEFQRFIEGTGYITEAEQFGWSFVFHLFISATVAKKVKSRVQSAPWWWVVEGATWKTPEGPDSSIENRMDHPVVHISWNDAQAYCDWVGKRLPTEVEWEFAARGGLEQKRYPWGDEFTPGGKHYCNIWQGKFPYVNDEEDGYVATAPAKSFHPNGYGLFNVSGNVWEWCSDWFSKAIHKRGGIDNPKGPKTGATRVMKGGSYLCHYSYCNRYRVAARTSNTPDSSTGNIGFRCVMDI